MEKIKEALEKNGKYWIAFVGDSITSTEWVHPNWREIVEYVLKDKLQKDSSRKHQDACYTHPDMDCGFDMLSDTFLAEFIEKI